MKIQKISLFKIEFSTQKMIVLNESKLKGS